jgi:septum formation inhibitor-activating ATPase MinD
MDHSGHQPQHTSRALKTFKEVLGAERPDTIICLNNLAACHLYLGDYTKALGLHQEALRLTERPDLSALLLGIQPRYTLVDVVRNFHRMDDDLLASYVERHDSGLHLLAPPSRLDLSHNFTREQIESLVAYLRRSYTFIVVDLPRRISPATAAVFSAADQLYLVTTPEIPSIRNLKRFMSVLPSLTGSGVENVKVVVNRRRPERDTISLSDIGQVLELDVSWTLSDDPDGVLHSTNVGVPIVLNGSSRYSKDLKAFCRDISQADAEDGAGETPLRDALSRLLSPFRRGKPKTVPALAITNKGPEPQTGNK